MPCFELHKIQKIGNSQVIFPVTHSTGIQRIMTTSSNKHSMLQKWNRKHSVFSHSYDSLGFTSLRARFRPKLWWEIRNVLKALSPAVNTKDVYMKRCSCSRRCPWAFCSVQDCSLLAAQSQLARWVLLLSGERYQEQCNLQTAEREQCLGGAIASAVTET